MRRQPRNAHSARDGRSYGQGHLIWAKDGLESDRPSFDTSLLRFRGAAEKSPWWIMIFPALNLQGGPSIICKVLGAETCMLGWQPKPFAPSCIPSGLARCRRPGDRGLDAPVSCWEASLQWGETCSSCAARPLLLPSSIPAGRWRDLINHKLALAGSGTRAGY